MRRDEAVEVLKTIHELFPKFEITKRKGRILIPQLQQMDYQAVMDNLSEHVVTSTYPPTIAEIAAYPPEENVHLEQMRKWREEATKVPMELKQQFHEQLQQLLRDKSSEN